MITLQKVGMEDAGTIHAMQAKSFKALLEKYRDYGTNPAAEPLEKVKWRMGQENSSYSFIVAEGKPVGFIRIQDKGAACRVSPICVLPEHQGRGYASQAMLLAERLYSQARRWELDTILEEEKLCRLYEKLGYHKTEEVFVLHPGMTLINYEKIIGKDEENGNL